MAIVKLTVLLAVFGSALAQFPNYQFGAAPSSQSQYQQQQANQFVAPTPQQYQQRSASCPDVNGTYPVAGQCDAYIDCKNGVAEEKLCPDGLLYNDVGPNQFPCQYPIDVNCDNRAKLQPAQATDECPHQFGYFKMGDRSNCGQFMNCVNGRSFHFDCPEGLAFSQETYRCEWPDMVSDCDAEAYVGFSCPKETQTDTVFHFNFHRHAADCQVYYVCIEGRPRMYRCSEGNLFNDLTNQCDAAENVTTCGNGAFRANPTRAPIHQTQTRPLAPVNVAPVLAIQQQQQPQFYQVQTTQKPFQFQFAPAPTTAQPRTHFNTFQQQPQQQFRSFNSAPAATPVPFIPQPAVQASVPVQPQNAFVQPQTVFVQPKALNTFAAPAVPVVAVSQPEPTQEEQEAIHAFIQPRLGSGQEVNQFQYTAPAPVAPVVPVASRTIQPESPRSQTRSQIQNSGQFNWRATSRGSKRYESGSV